MIDPSFDTITDPLTYIEGLNSKVTAQKEHIDHLEYTMDLLRDHRNDLVAKVQDLKFFLIKAAEEQTIPSEDINSIATMMDIELEQEYYFDITVRFTGSVVIPMGEDPDQFVDNLYFNMDTYSDLEIQLNDSCVESSDVQLA